MKKCLLFASLFITSFVAAQPIITFDKTTHDFGKVNETAGYAVYDFSFKNSGTSPLIIKNVTTTCGCTTPEWTKKPVPPGTGGFIKVSYDVKGRPGAIDKTITVLSNGKPETVHLRITGEVVSINRAPAEAYRIQMGSIRLDERHIAYDRMYTHEKPSLVVTAYNPGPEAATISFVNLPPYIKVDITPSRIGKGEKASIKVTYDAAGKNDWGFVSDQISMVLDGDKSKEYRLTVTATIEEDFSRWTNARLQNAPVAVPEKTVIEAGKIKRGEVKTYSVKIANKGKDKLLIRKVESPVQQVKISVPEEIPGGTSGTLTIQYDSAEQSGQQSKNISLITNDPNNAHITLRLKAEITE
ncbi:MAG: DUF1573 domain-containing protein [Bacteroidales bacterium]|jgi:hypothetical protein|nr:DUF1573 domain-containing protein [Bacteroidales bacterium]